MKKLQLLQKKKLNPRYQVQEILELLNITNKQIEKK